MEEANIYTKEGREKQLNNGIIEDFEEGFMQGYCDVAMAYY